MSQECLQWSVTNAKDKNFYPRYIFTAEVSYIINIKVSSEHEKKVP